MKALNTNENGNALESFLLSLSESLPAGASLKQRTALAAFLGSVFTEATLVQQLIKDEKGTQVAAIDLCSALIRALTRSVRAHYASKHLTRIVSYRLPMYPAQQDPCGQLQPCTAVPRTQASLCHSTNALSLHICSTS